MEEKIREHEKTLIKLKRARNTLLNIFTLPPEVLGNIFQYNVTLKHDFSGLENRSHNFLLVCHHWHEVALRTPEVWSFWGNTRADWARWCRYSGTAPLDLVLSVIDNDDNGGDDEGEDPVRFAFRDTLQDRAIRDTIRRIHLFSEDLSLLSSIISSLTAACEGVRSNSVESLLLLNESGVPLDVSDFFVHYRFPKLRRLELNSCRITSWDLLTTRTAVLTTISILLDDPAPTPTTSQLLSILASNPTLRELSLFGYAIPDDGDGGSPLRVPLRHLEDLRLEGGVRHVLGLLRRLDYPGNIDNLNIALSDCAVTDIPHTIGPYLRDHFRRRGGSRNGLRLCVSQSSDIDLYINDMPGTGSPGLRTYANGIVMLTVGLDQTPSKLLEKGVLDLIAHTPRDDIVRFKSDCGLIDVGDIFAQFPNLKALEFVSETIPLPAIFPEPKVDEDEGVLPSLQHIGILNRPVGDDWGPLTAFLARRASSGGRLGSLTIERSHMCLEVKERIRSMVQVFHHDHSDGLQCPFGTCPE